ncbi:hypothetical protein AB0O28_38320, partial [Microbispora sp. NPDC088329]
MTRSPVRTARAPVPAQGRERRAARTRPGKRAPGRWATEQWAAWAFLAPVVVYLLVFYAYPLYRNVELSLRNYTVRSFVQGDAPFAGFANYAKVFADATFAPALWHTIVFTVVSLAFQFTIGLALAVFFSRNFRLSATLR